MITEPFDLPATPPRISDSQRAKVFAAESEAAAELRPYPAGSRAVRRLARKHGLELEEIHGPGVLYWRATGVIEVGTDAELAGVLHEVAHHLTDPVFPAHGIEWATAFFRLLRAHEGRDVERAYRDAFIRHDVRLAVDACTRRVFKGATYATNREPGCLARVVMDGPPESVLCQLLEVDGDSLVVRNDRGSRVLPAERLRYISYRFKEEA